MNNLPPLRYALVREHLGPEAQLLCRTAWKDGIDIEQPGAGITALCEAYARQVLADRAERAAPAWQPIETAPKEGEFLVYLPTARMSKVQAARKNPNGVLVIGGHFAFDREPATHWQSQPAPPVPSSGAEGSA